MQPAGGRPALVVGCPPLFSPIAMHTAFTFSFARRVLWALLPLLLVLGACKKDDNNSDSQKQIDALVEAQKPIDDAAIQEYLKTNNITQYTRTESGLYIVYRKPAQTTGPRPTVGKTVSTKYTGRLLNNGSRFDSSIDNGSVCGCLTLTVALGNGGIIEGWYEALTQHMREGDDVQLIIPSHLGYGYYGSPPRVPSLSPLLFDLELIKVGQ